MDETDAQMVPAPLGPVERMVGRPLPKRATPGQVAHEAMRVRAGGEPWAALKAQWPAAVRDWECVAAAVLLHDVADQPAGERLAAILVRLRESFVRIGNHPKSFWDTGEQVAMIDSILSASNKTPNVAGNRLAEGKSELTGLLGGPIRSEKE